MVFELDGVITGDSRSPRFSETGVILISLSNKFARFSFHNESRPLTIGRAVQWLLFALYQIRYARFLPATVSVGTFVVGTVTFRVICQFFLEPMRLSRGSIFLNFCQCRRNRISGNETLIFSILFWIQPIQF